MNGKLMTVLLIALCVPAWAQVGQLYNADLTEYTRSDDPAKAAGNLEDGWLAFSMPVLEGTKSPCCWKGRWNAAGETGCSLASRHGSYGSRSDSPLTDDVIVYSKVFHGEVQKLRVFGPQCPVDGNGETVTWLNDVNQEDALDWLAATAGGEKGDGAMYALALHRSADSAKHLYGLAKGAAKKTASEAIFWLGEARGEQGFEWLKRLLDELPKGETRREINFALAMNDTPEAVKLLYDISRSDKDPEQRGEALFWLAQEYPEEAVGWLQKVIDTERDTRVLEQAVFAVSQLPGKASGQMLLGIASDENAPREARRQALFWLTQSDDDEAVAALAALLTQ